MAFHSPARMLRRAWCGSDARCKHGTTAEMEHRHREGLVDPLSGRDESWDGSSLALTSRVHTRQRGRTGRLSTHGRRTERVGREPGTAESYDCRRAATMHSSIGRRLQWQRPRLARGKKEMRLEWAPRLAGRGGDRRSLWPWTMRRDVQAGIRTYRATGVSITFQK
ncbi:hypothetical protein P171DRAFT_235584 [Karstenula rhodostoma CBS 690.94]|uniref:Uncharacterized protein n=1 Tax=Karstenula rhodostoma CBS 690.94 TaxID=1392251 RepID=A0A9P4PSC2_9PLEO|nr:hypothetical protein P171DRAFT_235584 [Karstenula rhodostoma CBS 690.94]